MSVAIIYSLTVLSYTILRARINLFLPFVRALYISALYDPILLIYIWRNLIKSQKVYLMSIGPDLASLIKFHTSVMRLTCQIYINIFMTLA